MSEKEILKVIITDVIAASGGEVTDTVIEELNYLMNKYRYASDEKC